MGALPVTMLYSDYREVQGMLVPWRITQSSAGQSIEIAITDVELNAVAPGAFELPAAVRSLVGSGSGN
jgi:hypothetical protein